MAHQTWTSLDDIPLQNVQRHRSRNVIVDRVLPAAATNLGTDRVTLRLPYTFLMIAFDPIETREALDPEKLAPTRFSNRAHFLPAGTPFTQQFDGRLPEFLALMIDEDFASETIVAQLDGKAVQERPVIRNAGPSLLNLGKALRSQFLEGRQIGALQMESFATLCLAEWLDDLNGAMPSKGPGLRSLSRVTDYIMANLDQELSLTDLATVAELSPSYFLRAFKSATGQTPHRFLMERRVQRACELLRRTDLPLAEVTYACGFASQSHMTDAFKRHLGIPPGRYRQTRDG